MYKLFSLLILVCIGACSPANTQAGSVRDDVLFLVLGKMAIYLQAENGAHTLRDHHFVAEIMPKETGEILGGTLTSIDDPDFTLPFNPEGPQFLAHGVRVLDASELHEIHPDGTYIFNYKTRSGEMTGQPLTLKKRPTTDIMPEAATLSLSQNGEIIIPSEVNPNQDLIVHWTPMKGNMKSPDSELADLIFVLGFDCFGNNIAHSGRPFNGKPYLTYEDTEYTIPAKDLKPGLRYTLIVEQATADVETYQGVPGIATYATLTFLDAKTAGQPAVSCPLN